MIVTEVNKQALQRTFARQYKATKRRREKSLLLTEFCALTGYHRKYAISLLRAGPLPQISPRPRPPSTRRYGIAATKVLIRIWEVAGYPWSVRLKALLPLWLPSIRTHLKISPEIEKLLLAMSPRTMDRLLRPHKLEIKHRRYGRTKPGTLLKHHIHIKTDSWDVTEPGFVEVDTVAHCGNSGDGEFVSSVNITDIHTTWTETYAVLGKGRYGVTAAIDDMRKTLPFKLRGIDSDNGSEFINHHLFDYCKKNAIQFTRGRPYKKNDNAHIEQKNWTHVRKVLGWARFDSPEVLDAVNDLCRNELRLWMNFFQPNVKLLRKERIGSRLVRKYGKAQTPLDRVLAAPQVDEAKKTALQELRATLDPFVLAAKIEAKLDRIRALANAQLSPAPRPARKSSYGAGKPAPDIYIPPAPQ
jgi:hypothetical protein